MKNKKAKKLGKAGGAKRTHADLGRKREVLERGNGGETAPGGGRYGKDCPSCFCSGISGRKILIKHNCDL